MITSAVLVTLILIAINVFVYTLPNFVDFSKKGGYGSSYQAFLELGWKDNDDIKSGEYYRLLTAIFLHSDFLHLLSNMWALWIFGPILGSVGIGPLVFLAIFLVSGIVGNLMSFFFDSKPSVGASGAIFGLVGFILIISLFSGSGFDILNLLIYVVISFVFAATPGSRIDLWGHLGGLLSGLAFGSALLFLV